MTTESPAGQAATRRGSWISPARFRLLAVMVPLHLVAFLALYLTAVRLLESAYGRAGIEGARQRMEHAVQEMPFFVPPGGG